MLLVKRDSLVVNLIQRDPQQRRSEWSLEAGRVGEWGELLRGGVADPDAVEEPNCARIEPAPGPAISPARPSDRVATGAPGKPLDVRESLSSRRQDSHLASSRGGRDRRSGRVPGSVLIGRTEAAQVVFERFGEFPEVLMVVPPVRTHRTVFRGLSHRKLQAGLMVAQHTTKPIEQYLVDGHRHVVAAERLVATKAQVLTPEPSGLEKFR